VLIVPIVAGSALLTLGLLLGLLQAWWQQQSAHWLREDLPVAAVYLGLLAAIVSPLGWLLAGAGAAAALLLAAAHGTRGHAKAALRALGELVERTLQLLINTLSFARIGAFALAHAGLSSAVVSLAAAVDNPLGHALVLVLGNLLIIAIEGLVVSIQTTRLVLFEFFTRFFKAEGREFRPLVPPPATLASSELSFSREK
jgi:V/A-type H+/Na+-transporting ATPase subunit I